MDRLISLIRAQAGLIPCSLARSRLLLPLAYHPTRFIDKTLHRKIPRHPRQRAQLRHIPPAPGEQIINESRNLVIDRRMPARTTIPARLLPPILTPITQTHHLPPNANQPEELTAAVVRGSTFVEGDGFRGLSVRVGRMVRQGAEAEG